MKEISYDDQQAYTASVEENLDPQVTTSSSIFARDLMNPDASEENLSNYDLAYSTEQIDQTRPNNHEWHGWGDVTASGQPDWGGAVRSVLLSGSSAELKSLRVDSGIDAESVVANTISAPIAAFISASIDSLLIDEIDTDRISTRELIVTDLASFDGTTEVSGDLDVLGPSYFETTSVFRKDVYVEGDLYVQGTASYINTDDLYVKDRSITLASGANSPEAADGAGFDIDGAEVEFHYDAATDHMTLNKSLEILGTGSIIATSGSIDNLTSQYITVETASGYFTGSFAGDASGLTGLTMSVSDAPKCKHVINIEAGQTVTVTHPFNTQNVLVQVYKWADPTFEPEYQNGEEGIHAGGEDEVPAEVWDEPAIQVLDAQITVRTVADSDPQNRYCVDINYPEELHGYVVIADAGLYVSGSGYVDIVEATREVKWFGVDEISGSSLNIIPDGASITETIEKGESYLFQHNLGTKNVLVQVYVYYPRYDEITQEIREWTPVQITPEFIAINDANEIEVMFSKLPETDPDPNPLQDPYFGYIVIGKAGCILKNAVIDIHDQENLDEAEIHHGTSGSWSANKFSADEMVSLNSEVGENLQVKGYIDAPKIGNLNTGDQYSYHDYYNSASLWGSYIEFSDDNITSYVRGRDDSSDLIPTASLLDSNGDLHLRGSLYVQESFNTSDEREKHNIKTLENALENVNKLRGVSFEWNRDNNKSIGIVAQEIQSIYPELTKLHKNLEGDERLSVNYEGLVGVLIEAVKALTIRVEQLEKNENR